MPQAGRFKNQVVPGATSAGSSHPCQADVSASTRPHLFARPGGNPRLPTSLGGRRCQGLTFAISDRNGRMPVSPDRTISKSSFTSAGRVWQHQPTGEPGARTRPGNDLPGIVAGQHAADSPCTLHALTVARSRQSEFMKPPGGSSGSWPPWNPAGGGEGASCKPGHGRRRHRRTPPSAFTHLSMPAATAA